MRGPSKGASEHRPQSGADRSTSPGMKNRLATVGRRTGRELGLQQPFEAKGLLRVALELNIPAVSGIRRALALAGQFNLAVFDDAGEAKPSPVDLITVLFRSDDEEADLIASDLALGDRSA